MKTITVMIAGLALTGSAMASGSQYGNIPKPIEISVGGSWFTGDLHDAGLTKCLQRRQKRNHALVPG